ncbi:MAG: MucBP domain-containing protein [Clostridiales bacterium]|nr:MucBP domain-containing protein [Clostridiales bacterium]
MKRKKYAYLFATTVLLANVATTPLTVIAETIQENPTSEVAGKAEKQEKSQEEPSNSVEVKQEQPQEVPATNSEKVEEQHKKETSTTTEETPAVENEEKASEGTQKSEKMKEEIEATSQEEEKATTKDANTTTLNLINGSFEDRRVTRGSPSHRNWFYYEGVNFSELGWKGLNTDSAMLCLGQYIQAPEGSQWLEVPNKADSAMYQDIQTTPGTKIGWSLYQRGFNGVGYMAVEMGAPNGPLTIQEEMKTGDGGGSGGWTKHSGVYTVPEGQTTTRFQLRSLQIGPSSFVDGVKLSDKTSINTIKYVDEEGEVVKTEEISGVEFEPYDYTEKVATVDIPGYVVNQEKIPQNIKGEFAAESQEITVPCRTKSKVTVKYIYDNGQEQKELEPSKTVDGLLGDNYDVSTSDYKLKIPKYFLDKERLPDNAKGKLTKEPIEVTYYYKAMPTSIVNGGFEDPVIENPNWSSNVGVYWKSYKEIPAWKTKNNQVELQKDSNVAPAIEGKQWTEIGVTGGMYQDIDTTPGETLYWEVSHRGSVGTGTAVVEIGAPDGELTEEERMVTPRNAWQTYSGFYTVPEGQTETRFQLKSISPGGGNANSIDNVKFTNVTSTITVNFVDEKGQPLKEPSEVTGYEGQAYDLTNIIDSTSIEGYYLDKTKLPENVKGEFIAENQEITIRYTPERTATVKYIYIDGDQQKEIHDPKTLIGGVGVAYDLTVPEYKLKIEGYELDENRLPENAVGKFSSNVEITYYYKRVNVFLENGGFEEYRIPFGSPNWGQQFFYAGFSKIPGWKNDNGFELHGAWKFPAAEGSQWLAIEPGGTQAVYQDIETTPGDTLYWEYAQTTQMYNGKATSKLEIGAPNEELTLVKEASTINRWNRVTGTYKVPEGQTITRIKIDCKELSGSEHLYIDDVKVTNQKNRVTIKYVNERGEEIKPSENKYGWEGELYDYTKEITDTVIPGYAIDAEKMPSNIKGTFTKEDQVITVNYKTVNVNIPSEDVDNTKPEETSLFGIAYMPKQFQTGKTVLNDSGPQSIPVNKINRFDVGVRDLRNAASQWTLSAQLVWNEGKELLGSSIKTTNKTGVVMKNINNGTDPFNPETDLTNSNDGVLGGTNVEITNVPTSIMTANIGKYNAVYNYNLGDVSLEIPDAGMVEPGSYSGNVVWSLENVPGNEITPPVEKQYSFKVNEYLSPQCFNSYEEAEEARHNYMMENYKDLPINVYGPESQVTNYAHRNLDIPEEYFKYKFKVVFNVKFFGSATIVSNEKFVTYQQAKNYLEEYIQQRSQNVHVGNSWYYVQGVISSSVTNLQGEDISGPIE